MDWAALFERAGSVETTVAEIQETLERRREQGEDGGE